MPTKLRVAIFESIRERTNAFNASTFPQMSDQWTPEQIAIYQFLNGESSGFTKLHESDKPEIERQMRKLAGIEDMKSRFNLQNKVTVPPYAVIVLRSGIDPYPASFPIVRARLSGFWTESGTGSGRDVAIIGSNLRPATEDDIATIERKFPEEKLMQLVGAIKFPSEAKLRKELTKSIQERTERFSARFQESIPEGITAKGLAILKMEAFDHRQLMAISLILDDPAMLKTYRPAPPSIDYDAYVCVVWSANSSSMSYGLEVPHVQAGSAQDVFFALPSDPLSSKNDIIGNHAESRTENTRPATPDEIKEYVKNIPADRLYLYVSALDKEQITSLL